MQQGITSDEVRVDFLIYKQCRIAAHLENHSTGQVDPFGHLSPFVFRMMLSLYRADYTDPIAVLSQSPSAASIACSTSDWDVLSGTC